MTASDFDRDKPWRPAPFSPGICSEADLAQFEANFKRDVVDTYLELGDLLSKACRACVVSKDTDAQWGPVVGTAADYGKTGFLNYGACYGLVEGPACGRAIQYEQFCYDATCRPCAITASDWRQCVEVSAQRSCASFVREADAACPMRAETELRCGRIEYEGYDLKIEATVRAARALCGSDPADGGADAGTD